MFRKTSRFSAVAVVALLAASAHATVFGSNDTNIYNQPGAHATGNGGQGGSATGGTGVGVGVGVGIGQGGAGGAGGQGGQGGKGGAGGSAVQGQQQGQIQGQQLRNTNALTATTGPSTATAVGGAGGASGGNIMQGGDQRGGDVSVQVEGDSYAAPRARAATAYAAPLVSSNGTCMGSSSFGVQGALGLSIGSTWTDDGCDARYDAEALRAAGLQVAAQERLCQRPAIAKAMEAAGTPCGSKTPKTSAAQPVGPATDRAAAPSQRYTDPIVRQRLGLPPL